MGQYCQSVTVMQAQVYFNVNNLRFIWPHFPWEMGVLGCMTVEELLRRNPIVGLVTSGLERLLWSSYIHFIKSCADNLNRWSFRLIDQWVIFAVVRKKCRGLIDWNLKSQTTTYCKNTLYSNSLQYSAPNKPTTCTAPVTATWTICFHF